MTVPARIVLQQAEATNRSLGHVNLGALSEEHGFVSGVPPIADLPPPFSAWTDAAAALPTLTELLLIRRSLDSLPVLDASAESLPDLYLMRASSVLGLLAHAYGNIEILSPEGLPDAIAVPWQTIAWRLDKPQWTMTTTDYMWHNWRLVDPKAPRPMVVENLKPLTSIWNNDSIDVFMMMVLEFLAESTPLVGAVVRAQEAVVARDNARLKSELVLMTDNFRHLGLVSLLKANPNQHNEQFHVDPVVWTKTFAALPAALRPGVHNATGVETPAFHMIDEFLERRDYKTKLGGEALTLRGAFPQHWRQFLTAVRQVSTVDYITASPDRELHGLYKEMLDAYQGPHGLLARHRLKAFAYLDAAFKTGHALDRRRSQVSGFSGLFKDRGWDQVDTTFEETRVERETQYTSRPSFARISSVGPAGAPTPTVRRIVFDVRGLGIRYSPGDRLAVLPENSPDLIRRTLDAFGATGMEEIALDGMWRSVVPTLQNLPGATMLRLEELLRYGHIRPVLRDVAKRLQAASRSEFLTHVLNRRVEDQWELWDVLEQLRISGFDPRRLLSALPGEPHHLCKIVPPMLARQYSISSVAPSAAAPAEQLELTVAALSYETKTTDSPHARSGTASSFLSDPGGAEKRVVVEVVHPPRFGLPADPLAPIVMFAGGTGIAPFRGFLQERTRGKSGRNILFYSVRNTDEILYREELEQLVASGRLELHVAISRENLRPVFDKATAQLRLAPGRSSHIGDLLSDPAHVGDLAELLAASPNGPLSAHVYVCGRAPFAASVLSGLTELLGRGPTPEQRRADGSKVLYGLIGANRYSQDVFSTYTGSTDSKPNQVNVSDLIAKNRPDGDLWQAIDGRVYDLTRFAHMHPGGNKLIHSYAGLDATAAYRKVEHDRNPEVDAMLAMFEIGAMRRIDFGMEWSVSVGEKGLEFTPLSALFRLWVRFVYLFVEIENAYQMEISLRDLKLIPSETVSPNSPFKLQFLIEAHHRFVGQTITYLCEEMAKLWRRTAGAIDSGIDVRQLERRFEALHSTGDAEHARRWTDELQVMNAAGLSAREVEHWHAHIVQLLEHDTTVMQALKGKLRDGLLVFEERGRDALRLGHVELFAALNALPVVVQTYYSALSEAQRVAGSTLASDVERR